MVLINDVSLYESKKWTKYFLGPWNALTNYIFSLNQFFFLLTLSTLHFFCSITYYPDAKSFEKIALLLSWKSLFIRKYNYDHYPFPLYIFHVRCTFNIKGRKVTCCYEIMQTYVFLEISISCKFYCTISYAKNIPV